MTTPTQTCPQCSAKTDDKHCNVADHADARCPWWRCLLCRISFRPGDGHVLPEGTSQL